MRLALLFFILCVPASAQDEEIVCTASTREIVVIHGMAKNAPHEELVEITANAPKKLLFKAEVPRSKLEAVGKALKKASAICAEWVSEQAAHKEKK